jgi:hypothetical protein
MDPAALYDASRPAPGPAPQPGPQGAPPGSPQGAPPGGDPSQGAPQQPQSPAQQTLNAPDAPTTNMEKATAAASEPGDGQAVSFQVPWEGDQKRELTPAQIKSTFDRYSSLNYAHSQLKPVLDIVGPMLKGANGDVGKVSEFLKAALAATQKDPTMGGGGGGEKGPQTTGHNVPAASGAANLQDFEQEIKDWEDENGIKLPGSVKAQTKTISALSGQIAALVDMVKHMASSNAGVTAGHLDAAKAAQSDARNTMLAAIKRQIGQNLDRAQSHHGLPNEAVHDFMTFMGQRGYTMEDMVDPRLAHNVVADFKANLNTPEMERLRAMTQRRLAATGSLQPAATGGGAAPAPNGAAVGGAEDPDLQRLATMAQQRRQGYNLQ